YPVDAGGFRTSLPHHRSKIALHALKKPHSHTYRQTDAFKILPAIAAFSPEFHLSTLNCMGL
ncbi:hypothetical protein, partial [Candidatus Erwinia dacicola]